LAGISEMSGPNAGGGAEPGASPATLIAFEVAPVAAGPQVRPVPPRQAALARQVRVQHASVTARSALPTPPSASGESGAATVRCGDCLSGAERRSTARFSASSSTAIAAAPYLYVKLKL
jgi:hypothetical protein